MKQLATSGDDIATLSLANSETPSQKEDNTSTLQGAPEYAAIAQAISFGCSGSAQHVIRTRQHPGTTTLPWHHNCNHLFMPHERPNPTETNHREQPDLSKTLTALSRTITRTPAFTHPPSN